MPENALVSILLTLNEINFVAKRACRGSFGLWIHSNFAKRHHLLTVSHLSAEIQGLAAGRDSWRNGLTAANGDLDRSCHRDGLAAGTDKGQVSRALWENLRKMSRTYLIFQKIV